jgi:anti-sigma factor RsiW
MEHEDAYTLMMEALDGELGARDQRALNAHLRACPVCAREWQALMAIETLFRQTPALSPAVDFTQRTLARLPNRRYRVWLISFIYAMLLLSGVLPLVLIGWLARLLIPALSEPALLRSLAQSAVQIVQMATTILIALWQGADKLGGLLIRQPGLLGWLALMAGIVFVWSGVYTQLVNTRRI